MKIIRAILIDDHPLILDAYRQGIIKTAEKRGLSYDVTVKSSLEEAAALFDKDSEVLSKADLAFLDISLPIGQNKEFLSGEDIGLKIRKNFPNIRIIISTTFTNNFRIHSILKNVDPEGFLIKSDLTPTELLSAIETVLERPPFYSISVLQLLRKQLSSYEILDDIDRRLLYELSQGTKMKDIPDILPLSIAGVEKRKRNLKIIFNVENEGDGGLLKVAREKGFI